MILCLCGMEERDGFEPYNEAGIENFSYLWYDDHSLFSDWIDLRFYQKEP